ncbi:hypothetical protein OKW33_003548 [Paraburkholderia atlantica]|uniref:Uncharacterized protein n=2 Tax=Paraburkholderia atlantica TaxID=2654982 RepID=A0A7W8Q9T2_PARAM|nr:hypothetical protein [Paraburkholderia atlantica]
MASTRLAMPVLEQDIKCLRISSELRRICPDGFNFVMRFASDNDLMVDICRALDDKPGRDPQPERQTSGSMVKERMNVLPAPTAAAVATESSG